MKKLLFSLLFISVCIAGLAQANPCDPAQNGLGISPGSIMVGQTADFSFTVYNGGSSPGCSVPTGAVTVVLSLPSDVSGNPKYYQFQSFISPVGLNSASGAYFDWSYLPAPDNVVIGVNRIPIPNGVGEANVTIRVIGTSVTAPAGAISNLNLQVSSGSNNTANDVSNAPLIVTNILATTVSDPVISSAECLAKLNWKTYSEDAGTKFDVEYSPDGITFVRVGTVPGKSLQGAAYEFAYNQGEGKGFYRLKISTGNGNSFVYSKITTAVLQCTAKKVFIYPNPIQNGQVLNVNIAGYAGSIKGQLLTVMGQVLFTKVMQNGLNHLDLGRLPEGTYNFKVTDDTGATQNYKVVVVK